MSLNLAFLTMLFFSVLGFANDLRVGIRLSATPATLDWNLGDVPIHVINNVVEGLYSIDSKGRVMPEQAEALPRKAGARTWRIRLKDGLKWSDGRTVRAEDYINSWARLRDSKTGSTYTNLLADIESARAVNEREIEIIATHPHPRFPALFTHWALFPIRLGRMGKVEDMVFNGPYKIQSYQPDVKIELVPNPHHRSPGKLEKIETLIIADDATALRLYEAGRLHFMADLGSLDRALFAKRPDYHAQASSVLVYLGIHSADSQLKNASARHTLASAIDRELLIKVLSAPHKPALSIAPRAPSLLNRFEKSVPLQKLNFDFGYFEKGMNRTIAEFLQNQWQKKLGANATLQSAEVKSYWLKLQRDPFPVFLNTFGPPVWDESFYYELFRSDNPMNMGRWKNTAYDRAVSMQDWKNAQSILRKEMPVIPLYFRTYEYLLSPRLKNVRMNPMTSLYLKDAEFSKY